MIATIYKITHNETGKAYVGKTDRSVALRWEEHCTQALRAGSCTYIHNALRKYGEKAFSFDILELCELQQAGALEIQYIRELNTLAPNGYNLKSGGEGGSHHADSKAKMSKSHTGKIVSDVTRAKMSASRMGSLNPKYGKPAVTCKPVAKYTKEGDLVATFPSYLVAAEGSKSLACGIGAACSGRSRGTSKTAGGYQWAWLDGVPAPSVEPYVRKYCEKPVLQLSAGEVVARHASVKDAAAAIGAHGPNVTAVLMGRSSHCKGFQFEYAEE